MRRWWREHVSDELAWAKDIADMVVSPDFLAGLLIACAVSVWWYFDPGALPGSSLFTTTALLGGAILAVILTALSILVAFLGEEYVALLEKSVTIKGAILPYRQMAGVAGTLALVSVLGLILGASVRDWGRDVISATTCGLAVWTVIGTVQIVNITAKHGSRRARMGEIHEAGLRAVQEKKGA
jgi:hypothetical protein